MKTLRENKTKVKLVNYNKYITAQTKMTILHDLLKL